jgi:uncharacterized iron-regulated membrane protein
MKASTLRTFTTVHTWAGLLAGFALFIAFYAGALSVFHDEIDIWAVPHVEAGREGRMSRAQRLVADVVAAHPAARAQVGLTLPGGHPSDAMAAYWLDGETWMARDLDGIAARDAEDHEHGLADFVYDLHYTMGIPVAGIYLMGIVSIIYGLALLSGLLIHLPNLLRELFALRPGHNLKRLWQDAHNVIGVLSLPFHMVFAVTGALLCLTTVTLAVFNVAFDGKLLPAFDRITSAMPAVEPSGRPGAMLSPDILVARARAAALAAGVAGFEPDYMRYLNYGDANATAEVRGTSRKTLGEYGMVALDATDGRVIGIQVPGKRDANHATYSAIFGLHFGTFGDLSVRWLYFLLGLAGAFLFYSGNLLYIESRRKRRQPEQPLKVRAMATATVGVCIGSCLAISAAFVANLLAPMSGFAASALIEPVCFVVFLAAVGWTLWRRPARAAVELLLATAVLTAAIAILDIVLYPARFAEAIGSGAWAVPGVDLVAIAFAIGFAWLGRATKRRVTLGDPNSVWARPVVPPQAAT